MYFLNVIFLIYVQMLLTSLKQMLYANTKNQFILDSYALATYCTSFMTKVYKSITLKLKSIMQKCIDNK